MRDRVLREFRRRGGAEESEAWLRGIADTAFAVRTRLLDDDHDPRYLHPGRSALILLLDCGVTDPGMIALAMWHDSEEAELRPEGVDEPGLIELRETLPPTGDDELAAHLVVLDPELAKVAIAERFDSLRHLHLRPVDAETRRQWQEAVDVWLPVAERTEPTLARRLRWWTGRFAARWAPPA